MENFRQNRQGNYAFHYIYIMKSIFFIEKQFTNKKISCILESGESAYRHKFAFKIEAKRMPTRKAENKKRKRL